MMLATMAGVLERWTGALILVLFLMLHPAVSEILEDCNCHSHCSSSPCVSDSDDNRLTVDCNGPILHWRTSNQIKNDRRIFLGASCNGAIEQTMNIATPDSNGTVAFSSGRECTFIGCVRDSSFCTHLFLNATCPPPSAATTPSDSEIPTTSSPSSDVTPVVSSLLPVESVQTGSLSGPESLLEKILPSVATVLIIMILVALAALIYKLYCSPHRRQRTILLSNRLQPFNIDYEEEEKFDDLVVTGMTSIRTYSMTSVLTILDSLSHDPAYSENSHHQIHKKFRIAQDLGRLPCSEHNNEAQGSGFTLPLSQNGSCVSYNPQDTPPVTNVKVVPLVSEETQGGDEGRIWSDLDMTCFSESDNENFEGDRDSKSYFKPENLENCQIVSGGINVPSGKFVDTNYCSGQDSRMNVKTEASNTKEELTNDSLEMERAATGHSTEITGIEHRMVDCDTFTVLQDNNSEDFSACEPLDQGFQKDPQLLQQDKSLYFDPSSNAGTDDSGFAGSDGVLV